MNANTEYRIIYYKDKRYNNVDRYVIVPGTWKDAQKVINYLESRPENFSDVSKYFNIDEWVVMQSTGKKLFLKPQYAKTIARRDYWK